MIYQEKLKFYQKNKVIIFCKNLKIFFEALLNKVAGLQCLFQKTSASRCFCANKYL